MTSLVDVSVAEVASKMQYVLEIRPGPAGRPGVNSRGPKGRSNSTKGRPEARCSNSAGPRRHISRGPLRSRAPCKATICSVVQSITSWAPEEQEIMAVDAPVQEEVTESVDFDDEDVNEFVATNLLHQLVEVAVDEYAEEGVWDEGLADDSFILEPIDMDYVDDEEQYLEDSSVKSTEAFTSGFVHESLLSAASNAFAELWMVAREEAATIIQRRWLDYRSSTKLREVDVPLSGRAEMLPTPPSNPCAGSPRRRPVGGRSVTYASSEQASNLLVPVAPSVPRSERSGQRPRQASSTAVTGGSCCLSPSEANPGIGHLGPLRRVQKTIPTAIELDLGIAPLPQNETNRDISMPCEFRPKLSTGFLPQLASIHGASAVATWDFGGSLQP